MTINSTLGALWADLYDCVAVRVDHEYLSFPAEMDDHGDEIAVELNEGGLSFSVLKDSEEPCLLLETGAYEVSCPDERGELQTYEILPLFRKDHNQSIPPA